MGYKGIGRKILAIILSVTMIVGGSILVKNFGKSVSAAEEVMPGAKPNVMAFAEKTDLRYTFCMEGTDDDIVGKIVFGKDYAGQPMEWYILGEDSAADGENFTLFSTSAIATNVKFGENSANIIDSSRWADCIYNEGLNITQVNGNHYGASPIRDMLQNIVEDEDYFTSAEQSIMQITPIYVHDMCNSTYYQINDILYLLDGEYNDNAVYGGSSSSMTVDIEKYLATEQMWLRHHKEGNSFIVLCVVNDSNGNIVMSRVADTQLNIRPAVNICAEDILFASSATATSSGIITAGTAMSLRLDGSSKDIGEVVYDATVGMVYAEKDANATGAVTLMVQGNDGTNDWYYGKEIVDKAFVNVSEIKESVGVSNVSLADCEVWIEKTDDGMIYANPATEGTIVSRIELAINTPVGNAPFDTSVSCNSRGINSVSMKWTDCDSNDVAGNAEYYPWEYVAVFEITPEADVIYTNDFEIVINNGGVGVDEINIDAYGKIHIKTWGIPSTIANITHIDTPMTPADGVFDNFYTMADVLLSSELAGGTGVTLDGVASDYVAVTWSIEGEYDETPNAVNTFRWTANIGSNRFVAVGVEVTGTVDIRNRDFLVFGYDAEGYSGTYDDEEHGITVSGDNIDDADITYSLDGTIFDSVYPVFKDAGEYTVYYRIEKDLHATVTGNATVSISKAPVTITPEDQTVEYGVVIADDLYEVSGLLPGHVIGSITLVQSTTDVTNAGTINVLDVVILDGLGADVTDNYEITSLSGALVIEATDVVDYEITEGEDSEWSGNSSEGAEDLTFKTDGDYEKFIGVKINGEFVEEAECVEDGDKTTIILPAELLDTLDSGDYIIEIVWMDGSVSTNLVITEDSSNGSTEDSTEDGEEDESEDSSEDESEESSKDESEESSEDESEEPSEDSEEDESEGSSGDGEDESNNSSDEGDDVGGSGSGNVNGGSSDDVGAGDGVRIGLYIGIIMICGVAALAVFKRKVEV